MSASTPPNAGRRSERARTAILSAARQLLAELGYERLTIEGIAGRAGVGKQTIYRWWPSKAAVVVDSFLESEAGQQAAAIPHSPSLESDLRQFAHAFHAELDQPGFSSLARILTVDLLRDGDDGPATVDRIVAQRRVPFIERLRAARADGEISPLVDLDAAADLLAGPIYYRWLVQGAPLTVAFIDDIVTLTLRALRP